jgi:hypothetical protein
MNRSRFLLLALCTLALASVASAATPTDTPSAAGFCNKLCIIGYHCVPNANGGVCKPDHGVAASAETDATPSIDSTDSGALIAGGSFCNKLCAYGFHCVPNANGGVCKPDHGAAESDSTDSIEATTGIGDHCVANAASGGLVASNTSAQCGPCTILCPYPTHLVQTGNCQCKCVGSAG